MVPFALEERRALDERRRLQEQAGLTAQDDAEAGVAAVGDADVGARKKRSVDNREAWAVCLGG